MISRMYKGDASHIETIDLQAQSHWWHLCKKDCVACNLQSKEFAASENKAYELLKHFIPVQKITEQRVCCIREQGIRIAQAFHSSAKARDTS